MMGILALCHIRIMALTQTWNIFSVFPLGFRRYNDKKGTPKLTGIP